MEAIQRAVVPTLQVEIPKAMVASSLQSNMDTTVGADTRSLDPKMTKILPEAVAAT
jgi:hypothetical protein